ncbi:family 16 glycosylhydrolase [Chitinispirillales bacterium ANBcel5]|uniref:family 16 glycosylhydrolase n=1 Tax=Cellulosispirillum alkaliphilum TaxID=3039283 RepID=UPI002A56976C|nr:family 16 glycosylhydrolase [Chitinispirillales bacterium ANBcel5]
MGFDSRAKVTDKLLFVIMVLFLSVHSAPPPTLEGWELVFEDTFEGNSLDLSKWNPTYNWGNMHNHRAYCDAENVIVEDGTLRIKGEARRHPDAPETHTHGGETFTMNYTSGAIDTRNKFSFKYGYLEGRFKAPPQRGTWPAFWTLQDGWPPEIDILEIPHDRRDHHYYLHYTDLDYFEEHNRHHWDHERSFGGVHRGPDKSADFYNYGVEWDEHNMNFYFDDQMIASFHRPREISQLEEQYILINLAIGGWAGNEIEVTEDNPAWFESEWIRVWQRKEALPTTIRLYSLAEGGCMVPDDNRLVVGDCTDSSAFIEMQSLGGNSYRLIFGDQVLDIPGESTSAGAEAGLWGWNGGEHQRALLEPQPDFTGTVVRIRMQHSNHYLRVDGDGRVIQDWNSSWEWNQNWRVVTSDEELSTSVAQKPLQSKSIGTTPAIIQRNNILEIVPGSESAADDISVSINDLKGRQVMEYKVRGRTTLDLSSLPRGSYIASLRTARGVERRRFVLER